MPVIMISMVVFVVVCYKMSYSNINESINEKMLESLSVANLSIQSELDKNAAIAESFYNFVVVCNKNEFDEQAFEDYLLSVIPSNRNNRIIVMALFDSTNIQIDCAENVLEACEIMKKSPEKYDVIFMDLQMLEMGGIEAAQTIEIWITNTAVLYRLSP